MRNGLAQILKLWVRRCDQDGQQKTNNIQTSCQTQVIGLPIKTVMIGIYSRFSNEK